MVDVWLPYGATEVCVRVPAENLRSIVRAQEKDGLEKLEEEVERALRNPIGSKRLSGIVKPGDKVALVLNMPDLSLSKLTVSSIMGELSQSGLKSDDLTVILAYNPFTPKEPSVLGQIRDEFSALGVEVKVHDHYASDSVYVGEAEGEIKAYLNRDFAESSIKIIGSVFEPNPYTLYNYGGCGVALGLSNMETVEDILAPALIAEDAGETIFRRIAGFSRAISVDFSIEVVRNVRGDAVGFFAGNFEETTLECIKLVDSLFKVQVEELADITVVSPGGLRFDRSIFSACGCLENALKVTKRNGVIILVAECSEGYGDAEIQKIIEKLRDDVESLEKDLRKKFSVSGFIAYRFMRALRKANVLMVSAIPDHYANKVPRLKIFRVANEALKHASNKFERKLNVSVILHGNLVIPVVKEMEPKPA
ncbi:MAG: lactate racemase domain-containing protein [Candidatus Bathyarchaeia archaeon]